MIRFWDNANYLGHQNLKDALDRIKAGTENVAIITPTFAAVTGADYRGEGAYGSCAIIQATTTFCYRIGDVGYTKGKSLVPGLIDADHAITTGKFRAGVILIDADGTYSFMWGEESDGSAGSKAKAIANLIEAVEASDLTDKAVIGFFVAGVAGSAFLSTASLLVGTNLDVYGVGGMALSTGLSTDGGQMMGVL
jgi:hypothetical protein